MLVKTTLVPCQNLAKLVKNTRVSMMANGAAVSTPCPKNSNYLADENFGNPISLTGDLTIGFSQHQQK